MALQEGYWVEPPEEVWRAAERSGLSIFYIKRYPNIIFVKDCTEQGPVSGWERQRVRYRRRVRIFSIRLFQAGSLTIQFRDRGLFGATNACHFAFAFDLRKVPQMALASVGDSAR